MKVELDKIYQIVNDAECADEWDNHSEEWQKGYDYAVAQIRMHVLELDERGEE